jgi:hypothetical protein
MTRLERNFKTYFRSIRRDHKTRLVRGGFSLYAWFWFNTQFWKAPLDRRPYTFIMRDWIYTHLRLFLVLVGAWYTGVFLWCILCSFEGSSINVLAPVWGSGWKRRQNAPFLGRKTFSWESCREWEPCENLGIQIWTVKEPTGVKTIICRKFARMRL